ncbi:MAG: M14 family zinc carboxypeptidase [Anaerolineae bacterium]|jgi:hypothetical protein
MNRANWSPVLVLSALVISTGTLFPLAPSSPSPPLPDTTDGPLIARVYVQDRDHLNAVAGELDIWETHPQAGYVVAAITADQQRWLESLGYRLEVDAESTSALRPASVLDPRFHYFDDQYTNPNGRYVVDLLEDINATYPNLTELIDIGDAWMAGQPGEPDRDLWVLRVTNEDPAYGDILDKPAFFLSAAMHAREVATSELAIRYLRYLTGGYEDEGGYGVDADVTWLVDQHVVYVLVMENPDGHVENERNTASSRRKNMDSDDGCFIPGLWGVDLNRNHSFLWGCCAGSSGDPCSPTYRGPARASEPETWAFESYFATVMKDQNGTNGDDEIAPASPITTTGIFVSLHSYGDLVLWPWSFGDYGSAPNHEELQTIGRKFAAQNGYSPAGTIWYNADGTVDDWSYGRFGIPSFTFEVGPEGGACGGFFPPYECIDGNADRDFWAENRRAFLYAHKIARAPYVSAYGPDAGSLMITGVEMAGGESAQVTAKIKDHRYNDDPTQPIAGAEYFVDIPGEDGAGIPMSPVDGGWGGLSEDTVALLDTSVLARGQHYVLVHGQSDDGRWGPFSAALWRVDHHVYLPLVIETPAIAPRVRGRLD